jgi:hypothetical protein
MEGMFSSDPLIEDKIIGQKSQIGICSFSEVHDLNLMWAHYADQFKGICIAYDLSRLLEALKADVEFIRICYVEKEPCLPHSKQPKKELEPLAKKALSYKNYAWLYEREWRMFAKPGRVPYGDTLCVKCVYLGPRMDEYDQKLISTELKQSRIKSNPMKIDGYSIRPRK